MKIDAHQHFWKLDLPFDYGWLNESQHQPICRDFLPGDLQERIEQVGVDKTIFVQTQHNIEENRWVLGLSDKYEFLAGVVGWVDLASDSVEEQLAEFVEHPKFVGVRHVTQDEPDEDFIVRPDVLRGLKVLEKHRLPFDLLFYTQHLKHAVQLGRVLPDLPMVVDHLSKPKIKSGEIDDWKKDLSNAAQFSNIYCKLSGMITEADWASWSIDDLRPYVEHVLECFGVERCMFGSDWPVCELAGSYRQVHDVLQELISGLSDSEQEQIFSKTAISFYGLEF